MSAITRVRCDYSCKIIPILTLHFGSNHLYNNTKRAEKVQLPLEQLRIAKVHYYYEIRHIKILLVRQFVIGIRFDFVRLHIDIAKPTKKCQLQVTASQH